MCIRYTFTAILDSDNLRYWFINFQHSSSYDYIIISSTLKLFKISNLKDDTDDADDMLMQVVRLTQQESINALIK